MPESQHDPQRTPKTEPTKVERLLRNLFWLSGIVGCAFVLHKGCSSASDPSPPASPSVEKTNALPKSQPKENVISKKGQARVLKLVMRIKGGSMGTSGNGNKSIIGKDQSVNILGNNNRLIINKVLKIPRACDLGGYPMPPRWRCKQVEGQDKKGRTIAFQIWGLIPGYYWVYRETDSISKTGKKANKIGEVGMKKLLAANRYLMAAHELIAIGPASWDHKAQQTEEKRAKKRAFTIQRVIQSLLPSTPIHRLQLGHYVGSGLSRPKDDAEQRQFMILRVVKRDKLGITRQALVKALQYYSFGLTDEFKLQWYSQFKLVGAGGEPLLVQFLRPR